MSEENQISLDEIAMLLGSRDLEIYTLQKRLKAALEKKSEITEPEEK